jgi:hypothetical protein
MLRRAHSSALALMLAVAAVVTACSAAGPPGGGVVKTAAAHPASPPAGSGSTAARPHPARVTIAAVGDTMLGSTPDLPPDPGRYLAAVRRELDRGRADRLRQS